MKTQISTLINGGKNVIRKEDDEKYINAKSSTSHVGYAGTNHDLRNKIAMKVASENPSEMHIKANGIELTLSRANSCSGKSWWWSCKLTEEQYVKLGGSHLSGNFKSYKLRISMDCMVTIYNFTKKSEAAQWRQSWMQDIDESFIEIL